MVKKACHKKQFQGLVEHVDQVTRPGCACKANNCTNGKRIVFSSGKQLMQLPFGPEVLLHVSVKLPESHLRPGGWQKGLSKIASKI